MFYSDELMDNLLDTSLKYVMRDADGTSENANMVCGDIVRIYIKVREGVITEASTDTTGCAVSVAASNCAAKMLTGLKITEAVKLTGRDIKAQIGRIPDENNVCLDLVIKAVRAALSDYEKRQSLQGN